MAHWAIIGSGLAGARLASLLSDRHDVTIFEKSHSSAGRMSSRRRSYLDQDYAFDHGAQYFTIKGDAFRSVCAPFIQDGTIQEWPMHAVDLDVYGNTVPRQMKDPVYVACPGMTALAKAIIGQAVESGAEINHKTEIAQLEHINGSWHLTDTNGQRYGGFDGVVAAIPAPQAAKIIPQAKPDLDQVKMLGCLTVMLGFDDPKYLPQEWNAGFVQEGPLGFISVNSSKPTRSAQSSLVVQARNTWADPRLDEDPERLEQMMHDHIESMLGINARDAVVTSFHRWRYASTQTPLGRSFWRHKKGDLAVIGDWCIKGRVEAAFDSGTALAKDILGH